MQLQFWRRSANNKISLHYYDIYSKSNENTHKIKNQPCCGHSILIGAFIYYEPQSRFARLWLDMITAQSDAHNFDADRSMLNSNADTETATQLTTPDT